MMGALERARVVVDRNGPWRIYQSHVPPRWEILGTVQRGMEIGALGRNVETGRYAQLNAGSVMLLDQRKVSAALGIPIS